MTSPELERELNAYLAADTFDEGHHYVPLRDGRNAQGEPMYRLVCRHCGEVQ